jgi:hypothetical protein
MAKKLTKYRSKWGSPDGKKSQVEAVSSLEGSQTTIFGFRNITNSAQTLIPLWHRRTVFRRRIISVGVNEEPEDNRNFVDDTDFLESAHGNLRQNGLKDGRSDSFGHSRPGMRFYKCHHSTWRPWTLLSSLWIAESLLWN